MPGEPLSEPIDRSFDLRLAAEVDDVWRAGSSVRNIGSVVAIEIAQREPVRGALAVAKLNLRKLAAGSGVEEDRWPRGNISDHDVGTTIAIQVAGREGVRSPRPILNLKPSCRLPLPSFM